MLEHKTSVRTELREKYCKFTSQKIVILQPRLKIFQVSYTTQNSLDFATVCPLTPVPSHTNRAHSFLPNFFNIQFIIILQLVASISK
jgi:hypothetical protein